MGKALHLEMSYAQLVLICELGNIAIQSTSLLSHLRTVSGRLS